MTNENEGRVPEASTGVVDLAYDIALSAYATAQQRRDSVHQRIEVLLSFVTTATAAAMVTAEAVVDEPDFSAPLLIAAGAVFVIIVVLGLVARLLGSLQQVSPKELYERWLHYEESEFKGRIIYWSGEHNDRARTLTYRKELAAGMMTLLFLTEGILFIVWVAAVN